MGHGTECVIVVSTYCLDYCGDCCCLIVLLPILTLLLCQSVCVNHYEFNFILSAFVIYVSSLFCCYSDGDLVPCIQGISGQVRSHMTYIARHPELTVRHTKQRVIATPVRFGLGSKCSLAGHVNDKDDLF